MPTGGTKSKQGVRSGHIVGCIDLDVPDLVDVIIDTIVKEAQK